MGQLDSGNAAWILTSASLVFLMTPGVAFFYGGMVRAKAVLNMMIMEAAALSVTMIMWVVGLVDRLRRHLGRRHLRRPGNRLPAEGHHGFR